MMATAMRLLGHKSIEASKAYEHLRASARERREAKARAAVTAIEQKEQPATEAKSTMEQTASGDQRTRVLQFPARA